MSFKEAIMRKKIKIEGISNITLFPANFAGNFADQSSNKSIEKKSKAIN